MSKRYAIDRYYYKTTIDGNSEKEIRDQLLRDLLELERKIAKTVETGIVCVYLGVVEDGEYLTEDDFWLDTHVEVVRDRDEAILLDKEIGKNYARSFTFGMDVVDDYLGNNGGLLRYIEKIAMELMPSRKGTQEMERKISRAWAEVKVAWENVKEK